MKKTLAALLLMLALSPAYAAFSASFSTGAASLPARVEMSGHFGNYTLIAISSAGKVTVAVFGAGESRDALVSELGWLSQNEKFYTTCDIGAMPPLSEGQEAYCNTDGAWAGERVALPVSAPAPISGASEDSGAAKQTMAVYAPGERPAPSGSGTANEGIGWEQTLQLLGAFLAVIVASYLILQSRQPPLLDAATERLLENPTRAGIMDELSGADRIPTDISNKLGKSKASIVEHLGTLMEAGLVDRIATPGKKFVFYKLTQKGRQVLLRKAG